ncbi:Protein patched-like protein 3, partial [Diplonema papillatum]
SRRLFLGLFGVLGIGLAVWATLGFASLIGMSFNGMSLQVLPYVSMGLGIDDMFVMLHYFPEDPTESVVARMTKCYGHAGPSITATSIINTIVFFVGASIPVSAVRDFAIQAGISVILNYTIIIFGFGGMLVYDARRIKRGACDVCICIESSVPYKAPKVSYTQSIIEFVMRPITSNIPVQVVLMLITLTIVGVSLWVASDLELGLPFSDFIGDSGIEKKYLDERTEYFRTEANNVFGRGAQWHLRENQIKLYQLIGHDLNNPNNPWKDQIKGKINTAESTYLVGGPAWVFPFRRYALQYPGAQAPENDPCSCYPATQPVATAGRFVLYDQVLGISEIPMNCTIREDMFYDLLLLFTGKKTFLDDGQTPEDQMINPSDPKYYPRCVGGVSDTSFVWETPTIKEVESALVPLVPGADEVVYVKGNANFPFGERVPSCPTTGCDDTCPAFATSLTITVSGAGYIQDQDFLRCGACQSPQFAAAMNATLVIAGSDVSLTYTPNLAPAYNLTTPSQTRELWHAALKNTVFLTLSDANVRKEITFSFAGAPTAVPATCEYASQTVFGIANKIFLDPTGAQFGYGTMSVYADQISWTSDWEMVGFKVSVLNNPVEQSDVEITLDMMQENRDLLDNYGIDVFATGQSYMLAEQYRFSKENTRNLIIICLCCAFVLMTLLMASVVLAAIMTVVMGMSMIVICASLEMLDLQLNGISMMSILFGIGINVELCVHICRAFLVIRPALSDVSRLEQNRDRVGFALSEMSVPVFDGAFTSFMGVLVLAFADIPFFRKYFFQFYSMLILISLWHAFIPLPILLCYLGPDALPPKVLGDEEMEEARSKAASEAAEEEARERELADHEP